MTADCADVSSILSNGVGAHVTTVLVDRFTWSYFLHADNADVVQLLARLGRQLLRTTEASPVTLPVFDRLLSSLIFLTVNARVWAALRTGDSPNVGTSSSGDALPMVARGPTQVAAARPPPAAAVLSSKASSAMVAHVPGAVVAPSQASDALRPVADHALVAVVDITVVALVCDILLLILEAGQSVALHPLSASSWLFLQCALARGRWPPQAGVMLRAACQRDVASFQSPLKPLLRWTHTPVLGVRTLRLNIRTGSDICASSTPRCGLVGLRPWTRQTRRALPVLLVTWTRSALLVRSPVCWRSSPQRTHQPGARCGSGVGLCVTSLHASLTL